MCVNGFDRGLIRVRATQILFTVPWLIGVVLGGQYLIQRYTLGIDDQKTLCLSGNHHWYLIDHWDRSFKTNDLMAFASDERMQPFFHPDTTFIKVVRGLPGQVVDETDETIRVDQTPVGTGFPLLDHPGVHDSVGKGAFQLQPLTYWVMGDHPQSFDSRYWGVVYQQQVIGKAHALPF